MYKWIAVLAALAAALGYGSSTEWLKTGSQVAARVSRGDWQSALPDLYELAGMESGKNQSVEKKSYSGRITRISDGDTVHVTDGSGRKHKIRMAYIDAPELNQEYGKRSRDNLAAAAADAEVSVKVFDTDRYGREVAQIMMGTADLNLKQISDGAAWHYESYAKKRQDKRSYAAYAAAQEQAGQNRTGLWQGKNPQAPWDFRKQHNHRQNQGGNTKWFGW